MLLVFCVSPIYKFRMNFGPFLLLRCLSSDVVMVSVHNPAAAFAMPGILLIIHGCTMRLVEVAIFA